MQLLPLPRRAPADASGELWVHNGQLLVRGSRDSRLRPLSPAMFGLLGHLAGLAAPRADSVIRSTLDGLVLRGLVRVHPDGVVQLTAAGQRALAWRDGR